MTSLRKKLSQSPLAAGNHSIITSATRSGNPAALTSGGAIHGLARWSTSVVQVSCPVNMVNAAMLPMYGPIISLGGTLVI